MFSVAFIPTTNDSIQNQWSYTLSHWKPKAVYLIGSTDYGMKAYTPFRNAVVIPTFDKIPGRKIVMSPKDAHYVPGTTSLYDFKHPKECTYFFGSDHTHLSEVELGVIKKWSKVYIPTDSHDEMFSFVAAAVTLAHRRGQLGRPDHR